MHKSHVGLLAIAAAAGAGALSVGASAQTPLPYAESGRLYVLRQTAPGTTRATTRIESMNADGSNRTVVQSSKRGITINAFRVAANGRSLIYQTFDPTSKSKPTSLRFLPLGGGADKILEEGRSDYSGYALSPDGSTAVVARYVPRRFKNGEPLPSEARRSELYLVPTAGGPAKRLTQNTVEDYSPGFANDGRLYFVRDLRDRYQGDVWTAAADGSGARRVEHGLLNAFDVTNSPDSGKLTINESTKDFSEVKVTELNVDGSDPEVLQPLTAPEKARFAVIYSPDGQKRALLRATGEEENPYRIEITSRTSLKPIDTITAPKGQRLWGIDWAAAPAR